MAPMYVWISCDDTHMLMRKTRVGQLDEWQVAGQVTLRQIYPSSPPMNYAWVREEPHDKLLGPYNELATAKRAVEGAA